MHLVKDLGGDLKIISRQYAVDSWQIRNQIVLLSSFDFD